MNIEKFYAILGNICSNVDADFRLGDLSRIFPEAEERIANECIIFEGTANYYKNNKKMVFAKLKNMGKESCKKAEEYLKRYDKRYKKWEEQAKAYVEVRKFISSMDMSKEVKKFRVALDYFVRNLGAYSHPYAYRVDEDYGRIDFKEIPSGYKLKCIKECDKEICKAFGVSSIAELKNI